MSSFVVAVAHPDPWRAGVIIVFADSRASARRVAREVRPGVRVKQVRLVRPKAKRQRSKKPGRMERISRTFDLAAFNRNKDAIVAQLAVSPSSEDQTRG